MLFEWLPCAACRRRVDPVRAAAYDQRALGDDQRGQGDRAAALTAYSKAISLQPKDAVNWLRRAAVYEDAGDWQQALRDATRAATLDGGRPASIKAKAVALQKLGRTAEALAECTKALEEHTDLGLSRLEEELKGKVSSEGGQASTDEQPPGRQAPPLAKPAAEAEASAKTKRRNMDIDYSKWAGLEDSDDDRRDAADAADDDRGVPEPPGDLGADSSEPFPSQAERLRIVEDMLELCRNSVAANRKEADLKDADAPRASRLPPDHRKSVGVLSVEQLGKYSCSNDRMLVSIYGDIYDVSHRPDLYGFGAKAVQAGKDITWAVVTGSERGDNYNRFYDIFKLDEEHLRRYLQIICLRMVQLSEQFGEPVGRLRPFVEEWKLPAPPTDEIEECKQQ
mmetsp:Transcript_33874/g.97423  ORF Transcript_33874/g.97423 Transcript_33874/m.97423 type:complete len:395 (-) Transcript_33874:166-1350(-)